ncbi:unnamed protein product [Rhodiola kirilowii]
MAMMQNHDYTNTRLFLVGKNRERGIYKIQKLCFQIESTTELQVPSHFSSLKSSSAELSSTDF